MGQRPFQASPKPSIPSTRYGLAMMSSAGEEGEDEWPACPGVVVSSDSPDPSDAQITGAAHRVGRIPWLAK